VTECIERHDPNDAANDVNDRNEIDGSAPGLVARALDRVKWSHHVVALRQNPSALFAPAEETTLALRGCERVAAETRTDLRES
jgi:hypothetical protein